MTGHEFDPQFSLETLPELVSKRTRGTRGTDVSAALLQRMARASDLKESLVELHLQGGRLYGEAMSALQRVLGNVGVERLHQQLAELARAEQANGGDQDV